MLLMGSSEPVLVPEWYRAGKGGKAPNASSARNRLLLIPAAQDSKRSLSRESDFGRRDRMENVDSRARARDGDRDGGRDQDRGGDRNRERRNSSGFNVEGSVIQASSRVQTATLDEIALRLVDASLGSSEYRPINIFVNFYSDPEYKFKVDRSNFFTQPNVDAAVVRFKLKKSSECPSVSSTKSFFSMI